MQNAAHNTRRLVTCRGSRIRTDDLFNPIEARYQAAPCPERSGL